MVGEIRPEPPDRVVPFRLVGGWAFRTGAAEEVLAGTAFVDFFPVGKTTGVSSVPGLEVPTAHSPDPLQFGQLGFWQAPPMTPFWQ